MKQLASFASLGVDWKMMQFLTLGGILCSDFITTSLCGMSILHLLKFFLLAEVWTITPKFCNCQTYECCQCIIANILKCSLSYFYTDTRFLLLQTVHLEYHQQRSFILKRHLNRHFGKIIKITVIKCHILKLKCTKFDFGWCSAPDPGDGNYSTPQTP